VKDMVSNGSTYKTSGEGKGMRLLRRVVGKAEEKQGSGDER